MSTPPGPPPPSGPPLGHSGPQPQPHGHAGPPPGYAGPQYQGTGQSWHVPPEAPGGPQPSPAGPDSTHTARLVLQILCPVLLVLGLSLPEGGAFGWTQHLLWALFATAAAGTQLITVGTKPETEQRRWQIAAIAVAALVGYWVVITLPGIASNAGFLQTLAVGCAAAGLWLAPGRTQ